MHITGKQSFGFVHHPSARRRQSLILWFMYSKELRTISFGRTSIASVYRHLPVFNYLRTSHGYRLILRDGRGGAAKVLVSEPPGSG
jgi:hypothetical protein